MSPAKRVLSITALVTLCGVAVVIVAAFMHAARGMGQIQDNTAGVQKNRQVIGEHAEQNQQSRDTVADWRREMESTATKTSTDVEWIRQRMEREHP